MLEIHYKDYIEMGFVRVDIKDDDVFNKTGFYPYELRFIINTKKSMIISSNDLRNGTLIIKPDYSYMSDKKYNICKYDIQRNVLEYNEKYFNQKKLKM